jgi:hypothetical protein
MRIISSVHFLLESDPFFYIEQYHQSDTHIYVQFRDSSGYPCATYSYPAEKSGKFERAIQAYNEIMSEKDNGADA